MSRGQAAGGLCSGPETYLFEPQNPKRIAVDVKSLAAMLLVIDGFAYWIAASVPTKT